MIVVRVEHSHRFGVSRRAGFDYITGFYDRVLVRRGVERALRDTVANLERTMRLSS